MNIRECVSFKELLQTAYKYLISSLVMFAVCFGIRIILSTNIFMNLLNMLATNASLNKVDLFNIISISQVIFGVITYIVMLIILKDEYVFKFLHKIKNKLFKSKPNNTEGTC